MISLMLDPRLKILHLVFSFIGHEQGKEYDKKIFISYVSEMLLSFAYIG
jgi:hypothetical protein